MRQHRPVILRAKYILPVDRPPILNGYLSVVNDTISAVDRWPIKESAWFAAASIIDLGNVALIPALVNAHTHLEFSHLRRPLGEPGIEFTRWIRQIVQTRQNQNTSQATESSSQNSAKTASIRRGLAESYRCGVGCIGEIATPPTSLTDYHCAGDRPAGIDVVVFHEQLGLNPVQLFVKQNELDKFGPSTDPLLGHLQRGISPHAPYSVHPKLLKQMTAHAVKHQLPLAMHLAETEAERDLLSIQTGPFVDMLTEFGLWNPDVFHPPQTILDILEQLSRCPRSLIIHGNYLRDDEIAFLGQHRDRMALVYCPRTHRYFGHTAYPLESLSKAEVNVAIGTDSRASNPDLNLFRELQTMAREHPQLTPLSILEMGTLGGAKALGLRQRLGTLEPGKVARLSKIEHPDAGSTNGDSNWDWLLDERANCSRIAVDSANV